VVQAGVSVRGKTIRERDAAALEDHLVAWPGRVPRAARPRPDTPGDTSEGRNPTP
jgi:hypothetical protein